MPPEFIQMQLAHMKQYVSTDRDGPKDEVMPTIQAALREPHPMNDPGKAVVTVHPPDRLI